MFFCSKAIHAVLPQVQPHPPEVSTFFASAQSEFHFFICQAQLQLPQFHFEGFGGGQQFHFGILPYQWNQLKLTLPACSKPQFGRFRLKYHPNVSECALTILKKNVDLEQLKGIKGIQSTLKKPEQENLSLSLSIPKVQHSNYQSLLNRMVCTNPMQLPSRGLSPFLFQLCR